MIIHSLLLSEGGGIIPENDRSAPEGGASIIIGAGGTGCDAVKRLKRKVYEQLNPSNPGEAVPRYDSIRFLAIDSDKSSLPKEDTSGQGAVDYKALAANEFIDISDPNLQDELASHTPTGKAQLRRQPSLNRWMNIDDITAVSGSDGAGANRQIGRFLLMKKAGDVYRHICSEIIDAKTGLQGSQTVNVYLFAGISGGTGSGSFIDLCYLTREALHETGTADGHVFGFFFLPDVVIAKKDVRGTTKASLNQRNGYAAFKELDYLMDLEPANDWFEQNYGTGAPTVRTQLPPVDLCHLISAQKGEQIPENGYAYAINVAVDFVMAYLAHVEAAENDTTGMTMKGHQTNIKEGVGNLPREAGACRRYTILGAANAEMPATQIATYLAAGYYGKFLAAAAHTPGDEAVNQFAAQIGLVYERILTSAKKGAADSFSLDRVKAEEARITKNGQFVLVPYKFAALGEDGWMPQALDAFRNNAHALSVPLDGYAEPNAPTSLIGITFKALLALCADATGKFGPRYAAETLHRTGRNLVSVAEGLSAANSKKLQNARDQTDYRKSCYTAAQDDFNKAYDNRLTRPFAGKALEEYKQMYIELVRNERDIKLYTELDGVLTTFKTQLNALYNGFFAPLSNLLYDLKETFAANKTWLESPAALETEAYTWRILQLADKEDTKVKDRLEEELRGIDPNSAMHDLTAYLLDPAHHKDWLSQKDYRIGRLLSGFMQVKFKSELDRTMEACIQDQYPGLAPEDITRKMKDEYIARLHERSAPMFWLNSTAFKLTDNSTYDSSSLSVPADSALLVNAAQDFRNDHPDDHYAVRAVKLGDRLFALRFRSGVPLYAYQGAQTLYSAYEKDLTAGIAGLHLYECDTTLREKVKNGETLTPAELAAAKKADWRTYLPSPIPYSKDASKTAHAQEYIRLYGEAKAQNILRQEGADWVVCESRAAAADFAIPELSSFRSAAELQAAIEAARARKAGLWQTGSCTAHKLQNDGTKGFEEECRLDYFLRYPVLRGIAAAELEKARAADALIAALQEQLAKLGRDSDNVAAFCTALFTGTLTQKIGKIVWEHEVRHTPTEENLSGGQADSNKPQLLLYCAYEGYLALSEDLRAEVDAKAAARRNDLKEGDDAAARKLKEKLGPDMMRGIKAVTQQMPAEHGAEILGFYGRFLDQAEAYLTLFDF